MFPRQGPRSRSDWKESTRRRSRRDHLLPRQATAVRRTDIRRRPRPYVRTYGVPESFVRVRRSMTLACVAESIDRLQMSPRGCAENRCRQYRGRGVITTREVATRQYFRCLSVCMYSFESLDVECSFLIGGYLQGIRVKFVYEGRRVKVNATAAKRAKFPIPAM